MKLHINFDDIDDIKSLGTLSDKTQKYIFTIKSIRATKDCFAVKFHEILDRTQAEQLPKMKLYVDESKLPIIENDDEFYEHDLIDLNIILETTKQKLGHVIAVDNFGAGDLLDIKIDTKKSYYVPMSEDIISLIDLEQKQILVKENILPYLTDKDTKE